MASTMQSHESSIVSEFSPNVPLPVAAEIEVANQPCLSSSVMPEPPPAQLMFAIAVDKASNCSGVMPPPLPLFTGRSSSFTSMADCDPPLVFFAALAYIVSFWPFLNTIPSYRIALWVPVLLFHGVNISSWVPCSSTNPVPH